MRPSHLSTAFLTSFLLGIFSLYWWQQSSYPPLVWILLGLICLAGFFCIFIRVILIAASLGLAIAFLAVMRTTHLPTPATIDYYANISKVSIKGIISDEPDRRPLSVRYTIEAHTLETANGDIMPVSGRVLVTDTRAWPLYKYGDAVIVRGVLEKPGNRAEFRYDRYLSVRGIYSVISFAQIGLEQESAGGVMLLRRLLDIKEWFESSINRLQPEPHASLLAGLLTGSRRGIPKHLLEDFNNTGLTHLIAISGYNITIVIALIMGLLFWLPLRRRFVPAIIAIILFTVFVGASASVVRAAIMGILGLLALQAGRQRHALLGILWTLFLMLLWNPKYLWYDASFQLSFLAVIGVTFLTPVLERSLSFLPKILWVRETLFLTIAAQLVAIPWVAVLFGRFSLLAPVANILVAPFVPLAMLFGFLAAMLSPIWFTGGLLISYLAWGCLEVVILVAQGFANIPYASLNNVNFSMQLLVLYYMALGLLLLWAHRRIELGIRN